MIFTYLYINNLYNFSDTALDFTLKRRLKDNPILGEYLDERPNFQFKRLLILSGANASGKTSLGRALLSALSFLRNPFNELNGINDKTQPALLEIEFVLPKDNSIHLLKIEILPKTNNADDNYPLFTYGTIPILKKESAPAARKRLRNYIKNPTENKIRNAHFISNEQEEYILEIRKLNRLIRENYAYYYMFSTNKVDDETIDLSNYLNSNILYTVLHTFDPSIISVSESKDEEGINGYNIRFSNKDSILIDKKGAVASPERLSKGTFDAIQIAEFIAFVLNIAKENKADSATYFLDEKMAYSHSELEQAIVNLILQKMNRHAQFIYTTHNYDILDMNFPSHSFAFITKENDKAKFVQPEKIGYTKNDRSLLNYIKNNVFNTLPDTSLIDNLLWEE